MSALIGIDFLLRLYYAHLHAWLAGAAQTSAIVVAAALVVMIFFRRSACGRSWMWRASFIALLAAGVWACAPGALQKWRPAVKLQPRNVDMVLARYVTKATGLLDDDWKAQRAAEERFAKEWITDAPTATPPWLRPEHPYNDFRYSRPDIPGFLEDGILWFWWGGAALLAAWKGLRALLGWRWLLRQGGPATGEQEAMVTRINREMAVGRPVQCRLAGGIVSPLLTSGRAPTVWLPRESTSWSSAQLRWVLRHELAHWKRRDGLWQGSARLITCFWWWNPLVWNALRQLEADAEMAADELAVGHDAGSPDYAELLVHLAQAATPRHQPVIGVAMLSRSPIAHRVRAIIAFKPRRGQVGRWAAATALVLGLVGVTGSAMTLSGPSGLFPTATYGAATSLSPVQRQLAEQALQAMLHRQEQMRFLHAKLERTVSRLDEQTQVRITSKATMKLEAWSDQWSGQYRVEFRPNVMIWTHGAAPFSVGDETSIETGHQRYYAWGDGKLEVAGPDLDAFSAYLGLSMEYRAIRMLTTMVRDGKASKGPWTFDIREVPWRDGKAVQVTESYLPPVPDPSPEVNTFLLDPALGGALVRHEWHSGLSKMGPVWEVEETGTTSNGIAYPKSFSYTTNRSEKAEYHTKVTLMETLDRLPPDILEVRKSAE